MFSLPDHNRELFNLAADHTETNDLSAELPGSAGVLIKSEETGYI